MAKSSILEKKTTLFYIYCVLATVGAYYINTLNLKNISIAIVGVGFLISLLDVKKGCQFLFVIALAFTDYTFESVRGVEDISLGGIYMTGFGGSTLMVYWTILTLCILFLKKGNYLINKIWATKILKVLLIMFFFSIIGFVGNIIIGGEDVVNTAISDVRLYLNIILGFSVILLIAHNNKEIKKYYSAFILILLVQLIIVVITSYFTSLQAKIFSFFSGTETYYDGVLCLCLLLIFKGRKKMEGKYLSPIFIVPALLAVLIFMFVVPSRGRLLALGVPLIIYLILSRSWKALFLIPIFLVLAVNIVGMINPHFYDYFLWKFSTFNPHVEGADSSGVRKVEMINILGEIFSNPYYFIFGKGLGGFFQTNFMDFTGIKLGDSSYRMEWIQEGKFYKPHGQQFYFLLKNGFVMTVIFYYYVVRMFLKGVKIFKKKIHSYNKIIAVSFLFCLPVLSLIIFSSKLQVMYGMMLGFIALSSRLFEDEVKAEKKIIKTRVADEN